MKKEQWVEKLNEFINEFKNSTQVMQYKEIDNSLYYNTEVKAIHKQIEAYEEQIDLLIKTNKNDKQKIDEVLKSIYLLQQNMNKIEAVKQYYDLRNQIKEVGDIFSNELLIKIK